MADTEPATEGPAPDMARAEALATTEGALTLGRFTLIGTTGTDALRRALVLTRGGKVLTLGVGDRLDGGQVVAIAPDRLMLDRNGRQVVLEMPQG
ncbi:MAG: hypothetical protein EP307_06840 [Rhodobacteraceae bacterium]|nr:MAG: hypothetical protein EP307_06840 [Paracoccaceae bacterium]